MHTIVAIASARGTGGVGVIRLSGRKALAIAETICQRSLVERQVQFTHFHDNHSGSQSHRIDSGLAIYFKAPHSFTGEDVVEIQCHGGVVVVDMLLQCCLANGAVLAQAGEFSQRAFLNDKMDLCQAEAVADLINAQSSKAVHAANQTLQGFFSQQVNQAIQDIIQLRVYVEAAIDFPDEEVDFLQQGDLRQRLQTIKDSLDDLLEQSQQGAILNEGNRVVIAGKPNVGKSSLLNQLAGDETALVTDIAGTTRDSIASTILIDGIPLHVIDTAGLHQTEDRIEQMGIARTWEQVKLSNLLLFVVDASERQSLDNELLDKLQVTMSSTATIIIIHNKIDLVEAVNIANTNDAYIHVSLSALNGIGVDTLKKHIAKAMGWQADVGFSARTRHCHAIEQALFYLQHAEQQLTQDHGELMAEDLKVAHDSLGEITGTMSADQLLGEIFSSFCIGK